MENTKLHKLLKRQLKRLSPGSKLSFEADVEFNKLMERISEAYRDYDEHTYTLERSLEISFNELQVFQLEQKNSFDTHINAMVSAMPDMMFLNNEEGTFLEAFVKENESLLSLDDNIVGKSYQEVFPQYIAEFFRINLKKSLQSKKLHVVEFMVKKEKQYYEARFISENYMIDGKETAITVVRNITKDKKTQAKLEYIATHDNLTKLPNRFYFEKKLKEVLKDSRKQQKKGALFFLDIDNFKSINDNLGHDIGDKILVRITKRLNNLLSDQEFMARFGGDEFVIIVSHTNQEKLKELASKILKQFVKPFKVDKYFLEMTTSIGICSFPHMVSSSMQLVKQADIAMYNAKDMGRNRYRFFTKELAEKAYEEFILEANLKKAIDNHEFYLVYQPQISLVDNDLIGVEALIRWEYNGLVPPDKFIPIAEHCGYIDHISDWVIEEVCRQILHWKEEGIKVPRVAINLSRRELGKINLIPRITKLIDKYKIESSLLEFEVTETAIMANKEVTFKNITALRKHGFLVSIDDFGTGYSSLANLKEFLFDKLKIDRSFVLGIGQVKESELIIKATIAMAHSLKLRVIAEGVETKEHFQFLSKHKCDEVQGYYCSRPILGKEISSFHFS